MIGQEFIFSLKSGLIITGTLYILAKPTHFQSVFQIMNVGLKPPNWEQPMYTPELFQIREKEMT